LDPFLFILYNKRNTQIDVIHIYNQRIHLYIYIYPYIIPKKSPTKSIKFWTLSIDINNFHGVIQFLNYASSLLFKRIIGVENINIRLFNTWAHIANVELIWSQMVNNLGNNDFEFDYSIIPKEKNTSPNSPDPKESYKHPPSPSHLHLLHLYI